MNKLEYIYMSAAIIASLDLSKLYMREIHFREIGMSLNPEGCIRVDPEKRG